MYSAVCLYTVNELNKLSSNIQITKFKLLNNIFSKVTEQISCAITDKSYYRLSAM